jgi:DNA-binding MarR family transcriptional regulator
VALMAEEKWEPFAPLPLRAMTDVSLTAEHFRVLAVIAAHDQFGRNRRPCDASHPKLATLAKCHLKSLSRTLKVLAERGYIEAAKNPLSSTQRAYRVIYLREDKDILKAAIGSEVVTIDEPDNGPTGNNPVPENPDIGNKDFCEPEQYQELPDEKRFCETVRDPVETEKNNSAESASPDGDEDLLGNEEAESPRQISGGEYLAKVQRWLKQHVPHFLDADELEEITAARDECRRLEYPVETWEDMADIGTNNFPVAFGDFRRGYLLVDRTQLRITVTTTSPRPARSSISSGGVRAECHSITMR